MGGEKDRVFWECPPPAHCVVRTSWTFIAKSRKRDYYHDDALEMGKRLAECLRTANSGDHFGVRYEILSRVFVLNGNVRVIGYDDNPKERIVRFELREFGFGKSRKVEASLKKIERMAWEIPEY